MGRNTKTERRAIKLVMDYEKEDNPQDYHNKSVGYDVKCDDKIIEVKGSTESKLPFVNLNSGNLKALREKQNFFIYVVYDLNQTPKLMIINRNYIKRNKKEKIIFEIPLRRQQHLEAIVLEKN